VVKLSRKMTFVDNEAVVDFDPGEFVNVTCVNIFLLNFTTAQRSYLLLSPRTLGLLYTPQNEHFGIVPIEAMACGLPVLATSALGRAGR
jgi:hypothetical protein